MSAFEQMMADESACFSVGNVEFYGFDEDGECSICVQGNKSDPFLRNILVFDSTDGAEMYLACVFGRDFVNKVEERCAEFLKEKEAVER